MSWRVPRGLLILARSKYFSARQTLRMPPRHPAGRRKARVMAYASHIWGQPPLRDGGSMRRHYYFEIMREAQSQSRHCHYATP